MHAFMITFIRQKTGSINKNKSLSTNEMNHTCLCSWFSFAYTSGMKGWVGLGITAVSKQSTATFRHKTLWRFYSNCRVCWTDFRCRKMSPRRPASCHRCDSTCTLYPRLCSWHLHFTPRRLHTMRAISIDGTVAWASVFLLHGCRMYKSG